jgi:hypothetical protein
MKRCSQTALHIRSQSGGEQASYSPIALRLLELPPIGSIAIWANDDRRDDQLGNRLRFRQLIWRAAVVSSYHRRGMKFNDKSIA